MNKGSRQKKWIGWATLGLSLAAIAISIIAICISCPRDTELGFDYQGVIVGVLSLLVTALLGWNIYTLIDMRSVRDDMDEISSGASFMLQKNMAITENTNWMIYHYLLLGEDPLGIEYRFLYHGIANLYHTSQFHDINTCNTIVKGLLECITNPKDITITKHGKSNILNLLNGVKQYDKIDGFLELLNRVALINTKEGNGNL